MKGTLPYNQPLEHVVEHGPSSTHCLPPARVINQDLDCWSYVLVLPDFVFYINGIREVCVLCVWLSVNIVFVRFSLLYVATNHSHYIYVCVYIFLIYISVYTQGWAKVDL